jgi:hypothetical protein
VPAYVHEAELRLGEDTDPAAVGAAVTLALCGHGEHEPPCRWPHNNALGGARTFRTLFIAPEDEEQHVRERITAALVAEQGWQVVHAGPRDVAPSEQDLAERLSALR